MDDLISRQAAIDLFPDDDLEYDTKGGYVAPHLVRRMICELSSAQPDHTADIGKKAEKEARAYDDTYDITIHCESKEEQDEVKRRLMSEPHWIPCSERLPEEQRYCLTSCKNGAVCEDFHWGNGYFDKADKYHHKVIAWMPLPKAYLGGDT